MGDRCRGVSSALLLMATAVVVTGCGASAPAAAALAVGDTLTDGELAALVERLSEPGGFFDTDNLISNETGYLNVMDALGARGLEGGAYVGVGPDQNFSYMAELRPEVAFIVDIRRDNLLHHLLLKALMEQSPTRVEFLSALHGVDPPPDPGTWRDRSVGEVVAYVDEAWSARAQAPDAPEGGAAAPTRDNIVFPAAVRSAVLAYGIPLSHDDLDTMERFHRAFVSAGPGLRFNTFGRAPRPYYPTYRQLLTETDADGDQVSYLADARRYDTVRALQQANRIIPVVGDLAGSHALEELGRVLRELGLEVTALYASNVEYYLWGAGTVDGWLDNVRGLPTHPEAVVIRSYFSNFGRSHPSAVPGYYATQIVQPVSALTAGGFDSYRELVTRDVLPLR